MAAAEEVEDEEQRDRLYRVALCITPEELQTFYDVCARAKSANDVKQCAFECQWPVHAFMNGFYSNIDLNEELRGIL